MTESVKCALRRRSASTREERSQGNGTAPRGRYATRSSTRLQAAKERSRQQPAKKERDTHAQTELDTSISRTSESKADEPRTENAVHDRNEESLPPIKDNAPPSMTGLEKSRLALLPAELRNRIYDYAFGNSFLFPTARGRWSVDMKLLQHPLTLTCRQMREESLPLFYHKLTVSIYDVGHTTRACSFFKAIGPRQTTRIAIRVGRANDGGFGRSDLLLVNKRRFNEIAKLHREAGGSILSVELHGRVLDWPPWSESQSFKKQIRQTLLDIGISIQLKVLDGGERRRAQIYGVMSLADATEDEE